VLKTHCLTLFFDTSPPAADVFKLVSNRVKNTACQNMLVRGRVSNICLTPFAFRGRGTSIRENTCQQKHPFGVSENIDKAIVWHSNEQTLLHTSHTKCEFVSKRVKNTHYGAQGTKACILLQICSNWGQACQGDQNLNLGVCQLVSKRVKTCQKYYKLQTESMLCDKMCQNIWFVSKRDKHKLQRVKKHGTCKQKLQKNNASVKTCQT